MMINKLFILCLSILLSNCSSKNRDETHDQPLSKSNGPANDKKVVCFVYHRVGDERYPSTNISTNTFESHLKYLKSEGFQVLTFAQAIDYLNSGKSKKKTAVITIDDGYTSFYKNGLPLLKKYDFPATLFLNTKTVGAGNYMSWIEIKEAQASGVEIGNHSHSHPYFLNLPPSERYTKFRNEINVAQDLIKKHTGIKPETFAFPFGEMDNKMIEIVKGMGFKAAAAQNSGVIYSGTNIFRCPRFPMSEAYADIEKFEDKARMHALKIDIGKPSSFLIEDINKVPELQLTFNKDSLQTDRMQCFIQGHSCDLSFEENVNTVSVSIKSKSALSNRRRTLYTLTIPDVNGQWYWYSHLWINPKVK